MEGNNREVEAGGLYICLWSMGDAKRFHWGIFVATNAVHGYVFQCTHGPHTSHKWTFRQKANYSLRQSASLLVALKVSEVTSTDTAFLAAMESRLSELSFTENKDTCRTWVMRSVFLLANEGYIGLHPHQSLMTNIQDEANDLAGYCIGGNTVGVVKSKYYSS